MDEKIYILQPQNNQNKANEEEKSFLVNQKYLQTKEMEELIPNFPNFDKIYENNDMNIFKEDILNYLRERDKLIFDLIKSHKDQMEKTELNYLELTKRISNNYTDILSSQAQINNRIDKFNTYETFTIKVNDQLISHEIRINNLRDDLHKATQKYDKIYLDNLELPGYIGKYSKYKNCQAFFEDVIRELNKLNAYKEKSTLDLKTYKEKWENNYKAFNNLIDNNNKSQIKYINEIYEKKFKECKNMIDIINERINDMRMENSKYTVELIGKTISLTKESEKIQKMKEEIISEFNNKIQECKILSNNTIDSFDDFKSEFFSIKKKFIELAEFIKDVRFRKNIGGDVKKKEIKNIAKKITWKKSCGKSIEKDKERSLMEYNFQGDKNTLRKSISHEPDGKLKNYIRGVASAEEIKQDSKIHNSSNDKNLKKNKIEHKTNIKNVKIKKENNSCLRKHKSNTVVDVVNNLRNLKKETTEINSEESDNYENNSITNIAKTNNKETLSVESRKTNYGTNSNNNRYLYKDIPNEANDKIINELASDLEQTNIKGNDNKEKKDNLQALINKIEPMNINMNINKIENLNYNNNEQNKEQNIESRNDTNSDILKNNNGSNQIDNIIFNFDKKLANIELYTKEKILEILSQMENLRQLFINNNKVSSFTSYPLFKYPSYSNMNTISNQNKKFKEPHIIEIGAKTLTQTTKIPKKYSSNAITARDKERDRENNSIRELLANKAEINLPQDLSLRIKTGKPPISIKTIINRTLGGTNSSNTIIFNNMVNDFNTKILKDIEKKSINRNINNKINKGENKINNFNVNKFFEMKKDNLGLKNQNSFKSEINLLEADKYSVN